jgi:chromosome condensin MukBEF MukE localization factor
MAGGTLGCKQRNHFRFLQSLQRHCSEFRQTDGINHFAQRMIMDGERFPAEWGDEQLSKHFKRQEGGASGDVDTPLHGPFP